MFSKNSWSCSRNPGINDNFRDFCRNKTHRTYKKRKPKPVLPPDVPENLVQLQTLEKPPENNAEPKDSTKDVPEIRIDSETIQDDSKDVESSAEESESSNIIEIADSIYEYIEALVDSIIIEASKEASVKIALENKKKFVVNTLSTPYRPSTQQTTFRPVKFIYKRLFTGESKLRDDKIKRII